MEFNIYRYYDIRPDANPLYYVVITSIRFPFPVLLRQPKTLLTFAKAYKWDIFLNFRIKGQIMVMMWRRKSRLHFSFGLNCIVSTNANSLYTKYQYNGLKVWEFFPSHAMCFIIHDQPEQNSCLCQTPAVYHYLEFHQLSFSH